DETEETEDIPSAAPKGERTRSSRTDGRGEVRREGGGFEERAPRRGEPATSRGSVSKKSRGGAPEWPVARLWVGAGRKAKLRPGDLVGAIANEVGIDAGVIGSIQIADGYSTVEVPEEIAEDIIEALRNTTIKGRRVNVRRDRGGR
ncbi:MAG: DbpA RNA binding domain-containing protein, partial [Gemmatimonadaceae bacterium]